MSYIQTELIKKIVGSSPIDIEDLTLDEAIAELVRVRDSLPDDVTETRISVESDYDSSYANIEVTHYRMETPAERDARVAQVLTYEERNREYRRQQYLKMKQEFESNEA